MNNNNQVHPNDLPQPHLLQAGEYASDRSMQHRPRELHDTSPFIMHKQQGGCGRLRRHGEMSAGVRASATVHNAVNAEHMSYL